MSAQVLVQVSCKALDGAFPLSEPPFSIYKMRRRVLAKMTY